MPEHRHEKVGVQARLPAQQGQGLFVRAGCVLRSEAKGNELTLRSDGDISMGQGSSIMIWWLRRAVNRVELAGCLLTAARAHSPGSPGPIASREGQCVGWSGGELIPLSKE